MARPRSVLVGATLALSAAMAFAQHTPDAGMNSDKTETSISEHQRNQATKAFLAGAKALQKDDLPEAVKEFQRAAKLDPENKDYAASLTIAKEHLLTQLVQAATKARLLGHDDQARASLAQAYLIDPNNAIVQQHINDLTSDVAQNDAVLLPSAEEAGEPVALAPKIGRQSFHIRSASTDVMRQVLTAFGITPTVDTSVRNQIVRFDADDVTFQQAATMLKLITNSFFVPLDPGRVLVVLDNKENRAKFQREVLETIYLPGLTTTEMNDMGNVARNVFEAQQASVQPENHTLTIRAPQERISALNHMLVDLLDGRSQVLLNLRLFQVAQTRTRNLGVQLPLQTTVFNVPTEVNQILQANQSAVQQIISSGLAQAGDDIAIVAILIASGAVTGTVFNSPFALFGGGLTESGLTLNQGGTLNIALNSSDTRLLDQMQLRVQDEEDATFRVGSRYPIITSTYSSLTGSSLSIPGVSSPGVSSLLQSLGISSSQLASATTSQTIPQVQYEDLGLTLKATPHIQQNKDIALKIDFKIESLAGQTLNGNPILSNQQYTGNVTLPQGQSALLVSNLTKQQSAAVSGIPGLSELPGFGSTTNQNAEVDVSKLVILITPQIVRLSHTKPASELVMFPVHP